ASVDGKIQLALRNPLDLARVNPNAIRRESLYYGASSAPAPTPPPAAKPVAVRNPAPKVTPPPAPIASAPPPAPVAPPPAKLELQLIQGSKKESVVFEKKDDLVADAQSK